MKWKETAMRITEDVYDERYDDEDITIELIHFMVDKHNNEKFDVDEAYNTVLDARKNDYDIFIEANLLLVEKGEDVIGFDETIDDVVVRLARFIIREKAVDYYMQLKGE